MPYPSLHQLETRRKIVGALAEFQIALVRIVINDLGDLIDQRAELPADESQEFQAIFADLGDHAALPADVSRSLHTIFTDVSDLCQRLKEELREEAM